MLDHAVCADYSLTRSSIENEHTYVGETMQAESLQLNVNVRTSKMTPRLDEETPTRRVNMFVSAAWAKQVDEWRRREPLLPNFSEAIRQLVDIGIAAVKERRKRD
jgi:hypothetical protein